MKTRILTTLILLSLPFASASALENYTCQHLVYGQQIMIKTALDGVERTDAEQVVVGMYLGYVAGFMDSNEVEFKKEGIVLDNVFNTDPGSASGKLGVWLLSHPQYWDRSAHYCMSRAFIHAYLKN